MIKPNPMLILCTQCHWKMKFAPNSDALAIERLPECCPKCRAELTMEPLQQERWLKRILARMGAT